MLHLLTARVGLLVGQHGRAHHEPRGAEAALDAPAVGQGLLDRVQAPVGRGQALDGGDARSVGAGRGHQARQHGPAVEVDGAGAALALGAALLGAGQPEVESQPVQQRPARRVGGAALDAVDGGGDGAGVADLPPGGLLRSCRFRSIGGDDQAGRALGPGGGLSAGRQGAQRPLHHHLDRVAAVLGGGAQVVDGGDRGPGRGRDLGGRVVEEPAPGYAGGRVHQLDGRADTAQGHHQVGDRPVAALGDDRGRVDHRDGLRPPQPELHEDAPAAPTERVEGDPGHEFARLQRGGSETGEEVLDRHGPGPASRRRDSHVGAERVQRGDGVVGRAGRDDVADDRGPVAKLRTPDLQAGLREREPHRQHPLEADHVAVGDQRPQLDPTAVLGDRVEPVEHAQINEGVDAGPRAAAELQQQVGAAGDGAGRGAARREHVQGVLQRLGRYISSDRIGPALGFVKLAHGGAGRDGRI